MNLEVYKRAPSVRFLGISDRRQIDFPRKLSGHRTKIRKREREDKKHQHEIKHFVAQRDLKVSNVALRTTALYPVTHTEDIYCISGVHMFSRNLRATSKF
jgi:hypothetical protein